MMARCMVTIEPEPMVDAIAQIEVIIRALPTRHGAAFRELDGRIMALRGQTIAPGPMHDLGEGVLTFEAPTILVDIIRDARALGIVK